MSETPTSSDKQRLKNAILALVSTSPQGVPYSRLGDLAGFKGEAQLSHPQFPQILFWRGLSNEAAQAVRDLLDSQQIAHNPTDELAYLAQGDTLDLPILTPELARRASELKSPHWMPVLLVLPSKTR